MLRSLSERCAFVAATGSNINPLDGDALQCAPPANAFRLTDTKILLVSTFEAWYRHNAPRLGASLAFYTILSLAPLLIVVMAVASLLFGRIAAEGQIVWHIQDLVGREGAEVIQQMMEGARKPTSGVLATLIGLLALFMGATAVVVELRDALNTIWEIPAKARHWQGSFVNLLKERVLSFLVVLGVGFLLIVALTMNAWLAAGEIVGDRPPISGRFLQSINSAVSFIVIAGLSALIYKGMPDVELRWRDVIAGAALTSLLFSLGRVLIEIYLGKTSLGSTYGAAGSLVVLLVWVYYLAQIFLLGAEFTQVFARRYSLRPIHRSVVPPSLSPSCPQAK